ncbi:MAG: protease complex subunit PrcB family protein [Gammaproteobacteria bacterium]|nr:protease complex subunit PrcB family protein [Gammaproteobacteria bacterium]
MKYLVNNLILTAIVLAGCNSAMRGEASPKALTAQTIYRSMLCAGQQAAPVLRWITAEDAYQEMYPGIVPDHPDGHPVSAPTVDFSEDAVLLISMGQRRTAGYNLELSRDLLRLRNGELTLPVVWTEPADGLFVAQVITHPCLIITLPRRDIRSVTVIDQNGSVLLSGERK